MKRRVELNKVWKWGQGLLTLSLLVLSFVLDCTCQSKPDSTSHFDKNASKNQFALIFTTNLQGYVEPCGCTSDPLGGVGRLAALVEQANASFDGRVFYVDAGNLLFDSLQPRGDADLCQDDARIDLLLSSLSSLKVVGTVPGSFDEVRGAAFRDHHLQKSQITALNQIPLRGRLIERGGVKIGLLGVRLENDKAINELRSTVQMEASGLKAQGAKLVVLVSQSRTFLTKELMRGLTDVTIVVQGQDTGEKPLPPEALGPKGPWLVSAGMQGQYLGVLEFSGNGQAAWETWTLDIRKLQQQGRVRLLEQRAQVLRRQVATSEDAQRQSFFQQRLNETEAELAQISASGSKFVPLSTPYFEMRAIPLDRNIVPTKAIQAKLDAYEASIPALVSKCEGNVVCEKPKAGQATYVGAETCRGCHQAAYDVWKKAIVTLDGKDKLGAPIKRQVGHSKAWHTLEEMHKDLDRSCVSCHSIGFDKPGGYCKTSEVDFRKNVQCESCHGPGSLHVATADKRLIRREVPEGVCRECHHVPHIPTSESFVYNDKVKLILGEGHGSSLLEKLNHQARK